MSCLGGSSVARFVFCITQSPPLLVKSEVDVARVALPSGWFTIMLLVILVNVNDVVACGFGGAEDGTAVLAVCGADGLVATAVCTRVHYDGVSD